MRDAPPADGRFPVVLQFHGANGHRRDRAYLCTHLASHGYPFAELCTEARAHDTVRALCLAHMDAHLKGDADATAFLDGDLTDVLAARSIGLELSRG